MSLLAAVTQEFIKMIEADKAQVLEALGSPNGCPNGTRSGYGASSPSCQKLWRRSQRRQDTSKSEVEHLTGQGFEQVRNSFCGRLRSFSVTLRPASNNSMPWTRMEVARWSPWSYCR